MGAWGWWNIWRDFDYFNFVVWVVGDETCSRRMTWWNCRYIELYNGDLGSGQDFFVIIWQVFGKMFGIFCSEKNETPFLHKLRSMIYIIRFLASDRKMERVMIGYVNWRFSMFFSGWHNRSINGFLNVLFQIIWIDNDNIRFIVYK